MSSALDGLVVVNLDITPVEPPEQVLWKDPIHK